MLIAFEHVGMTVSNMDRAVAFYCDLLGLTLAQRNKVDRGEIGFFDTGAGMLEVFAPEAPTVDRFRDVPLHEAGIRHLTFAYSDLAEVLGRLEAAGVEVIEGPRGARNTPLIKQLAFVRDPDGIMVELIERGEGR